MSSDIYSTTIEVGDTIVTCHGDRYVVHDIVPDRSDPSESCVKGFFIDQNDIVDSSMILDLGVVDSTSHKPNRRYWTSVAKIEKNPTNVWTISAQSDLPVWIDQLTIKQTIDAPKKPQSRECPCGIFRADCTYHR